MRMRKDPHKSATQGHPVDFQPILSSQPVQRLRSSGLCRLAVVFNRKKKKSSLKVFPLNAAMLFLLQI